MKVRVDCKDNVTSYIRVSKDIKQKQNGYDYQFFNEKDELILTVSNDSLKAASFWPDSYTQDKLQDEKNELVKDSLRKKVNNYIHFGEVLPSLGRFSVKNAKGRRWLCLVSKDEVDEFSTVSEVFEVPRFFLTAQYSMREEELELDNVDKIAYTLKENLRQELVNSTSLLNVDKTTSVRFGEVETKSWLDVDNWNWNIIARIEVAIFGEVK